MDEETIIRRWNEAKLVGYGRWSVKREITATYSLGFDRPITKLLYKAKVTICVAPNASLAVDFNVAAQYRPEAEAVVFGVLDVFTSVVWTPILNVRISVLDLVVIEGHNAEVAFRMAGRGAALEVLRLNGDPPSIPFDRLW